MLAVDAIEVFRFNSESFPESWNVYDSMAEAYLKAGDTENAVAHYEKSLALNPNNGHAAEVLQTLKGRRP